MQTHLPSDEGKHPNTTPRGKAQRNRAAVKPASGHLVTLRNPGTSGDGESRHEPHLPVQIPDQLDSADHITTVMQQLIAERDKGPVTSALVPWFCNKLRSNHSRVAYMTHLAHFITAMRSQGIESLDVTGDDVAIYKDALDRADVASGTIANRLSVIRQTYEQLAKKGIVDWPQVWDIQAVVSPAVDKNTTPDLTEEEACKLLHTPNTSTVTGMRDYAMLFVFFRTAARVSAITAAKVKHLEWRGKELHLVVTEKRKRVIDKALLEAGPVVSEWMRTADITGEQDWPLFPAIDRDRVHVLKRHLSRDTVRKTVKKYAKQAGIQVERAGRRGIGVHSLRKTTLNNAIRHGAKMEQVQALAGHKSITSTQVYFTETGKESEEAARHVQIR